MPEGERVRRVLRPEGNATLAIQLSKSRNEVPFPLLQPQLCITRFRTPSSQPKNTCVKNVACESPIRNSNMGSTSLKSSQTALFVVRASCSSEGPVCSSCRLSDAQNVAAVQISAAHRKLRMSGFGRKQGGRIVPDGVPLSPPVQTKKRCGWITPNSDPAYVAFHDEEWGVPVHDDKRLFELLVLSGALAELSWPAILNSRKTFREVFAGFDPAIVADFDDKKITSLESLNNALLHEGKLHGIVNNAKYVLKIMEEFGSLDKYMWSFIGQKPIVNRFRYARQVPTKTPKAEVISKYLIKRGFRFVSPTVIYSFMQAAGMTNDHLVHCFRFEECAVQGGEMIEKERAGATIPTSNQFSEQEL